MPNINCIKNLNYTALSNEILSTGIAIVRDLFSIDEINCYLKECEQKFKISPILEGKTFTPKITPDYVQPWSINYAKKRIASYRLYEFYHNDTSANSLSIRKSALSIRDQIESPWQNELNKFNIKMNHYDYNIVSKYLNGSGYLQKHCDMDPNLPFPSLQTLLPMTEFESDYRGGDLVLYLKSGEKARMIADLNVKVGDLLFFDKRLYHEVEGTIDGTGCNRGRFSALIGAKTIPRPKPSLIVNYRRKAKRFVQFQFPELYRKITGKILQQDSLY